MLDRETREEATFTKTSMKSEVREHPRYRVDLDVTLASDHNFYAGFVENLSAGGVFVATHGLKPVGTRIELSITLPDSDHVVRGVGEVRWVREYSETSNVPPGLGIRFVSLEPGAEAGIAHFLSGRAPLFWED